MISPSLAFWLRLGAALAVEVCCLAALGFAAQQLARSAFWRRAAWQITVVCLLAAAMSEWTGVGRGLADHFAPRRKAVEYKPSPGASFALRGESVAVQIAALPPPEKQAGAVWWPGLVGLAGTILVLGRTALAQGLLLALRLKRDRITDGSLRDRVARLSPRLGLRRKIRLRRMPALISPMAFGLFRPCIGLPAEFETRFSPAEQDAVLAHEMAHLAARDPVWFLLADLAVAALWWNPLAWRVRRRLHVVSEQAADEATTLVPDGPDALARCLVALGKEMADVGAWGWVGINGGVFRSNLGKRVESLLQLSGGPPPRLNGRFAAAAKIAAILAAAPLAILAFGAIQTTQAQPAESWRSQFEESWRQSPAGVLLLAQRDDAPKPDTTNQVENTPPFTEIQHIYPIKVDYKDLRQRFPKLGLASTNAAALHQQIRQFLSNAGVRVTNETGLNVFFNDHLGEMLIYARSLEDIKNAKTAVMMLKQPPPLDETGKDDAAVAIVTQTKLQNAKLLYEMGRYDDAETLLNQLLKDDPSNRTAPYYLDLIKEARFMHYDRLRYEKDGKIRQFLDENGKIRPIPMPLSGENLPVPHLRAATNLVFTTLGRKQILTKLENIMFDEVSYDLPLKDVLNRLRSESQKRDPDGVGVNFMINPKVDTSGLPASTNTTGAAPAGAKAPQRQDIGAEVTIRISPPLKNVRLVDVLDAITKAADLPIRYTVEDYAVVFSPKPPDEVQAELALLTKTFKVNPNTFVRRLESDSPVKLTNNTLETHTLARAYFTAAGIDFNVAGKTIFFNDRLGVILVRATASDLEIIQKAIEILNQTPPQVMIEARFVELSEEDTRAIGFGWYMGNTLVNSGFAGLQGVTAPSHQEQNKTANPSGIFPASNSPGTVRSSASNDLVANGLRNNYGSGQKMPTAPTVTGIMTAPQFRVAINAIEQRLGTEILALPRVTTESGRQVRLGVLEGNGGVELDAIATVGPDGFTIQTTAIPSIKKDGQSLLIGVSSLKLWDGQTLVIGGETTNNPSGARKMRMVFVTPIIIDPAGNRVHTDGELSKRPGIPDQRP